MTIREIETELEKLRNELVKHHQAALEDKAAAREAKIREFKQAKVSEEAVMKCQEEYYAHFERSVILDSAIANLKPVLAELSRIA